MKKITDYQPLQRNPNKGNQRGTGILDQSVRELGAGRSILVDKNGVILAGNHAQEAFVNAGIENVIEVETDGSQIVVVKRTDMEADSVAGQKMAIMDNRTVEVGLEWDNIVLGEMLEEIKASDGELDRFLDDLADNTGTMVDIPFIDNDIDSNTSKKAQYEKVKMPLNIGALLLFVSPDEQVQYSENFGVFYSDGINDNVQVKQIFKEWAGKLADEICNIL
jgi:hypothetical protein